MKYVYQNEDAYTVRHRCWHRPKPQVFALYLDAQEFVTERRKVKLCTEECRARPTKIVRAMEKTRVAA